MEKTYNPQDIEKRWYQIWEDSGYFSPAMNSAADPVKDGDKPPYCIMIPPPNVTGNLHMGHGFNNTIMDTLTRFHRMQGQPTLWQPGTDHAGIATQMVVERQLEAEGKTRHDLGRDAFIERIWDWRKESGGNITRQLRRMGSSLDWANERFTMDDGLSEAVKEVFVRLHEEGLIYRGKRLVNWDPVLHTAVSDLEVISEEENGHLWHMRYPLTNGTGHLVVATTRPETLLGDCAVAIHPSDERYKHLIGELVELPLTGRKIPIIADEEHVDPEFGTGCVKITPAHDFNDYAVGARHKLALVNIFTVDASIREKAELVMVPGSEFSMPDGSVFSQQDGDYHDGIHMNTFIVHSFRLPQQYLGMDRYAARKQILADLEAAGLLDKTDKHKPVIPRGDRSGAVIEPFLTDQWYVKVAPLAKPAIEAVENGDVRFIPDNWKNTYFDWMNNIQDWCISRQIWWGHRIPAWYDDEGNIYVGRSEEEVRTKHKLAADYPLRQDEDVLDTWFSSALWPFSTLGWPQDTERLKTFYPTSVLVTGFDIIFFWVARMIMMGLKFTDQVPFKEIYIHGLVRDSHGDKMSKSKGNVLDPIDLIDGIELEPLVSKRTAGMMQPKLAKKIEKQTRKEFPDGIPGFGTDALRFTFAAMASTGRDIKFDLSRIEGYRNFCNKIWNAARYVLMNTENLTGESEKTTEVSAADCWILSRLQITTQAVTEALEQYRFDHAAQAIYEFTWNEYCDWYLELSKTVLNNDSASDAAKRGTRVTLVVVLESLLRLTHPIMPYITEEIWQRIAPLAGVRGDSIMQQPYPVYDASLINDDAISEIEWAIAFIQGIRRIKAEQNIAPGKPVPVFIANASDKDQQRLVRVRPYLDFLAKTESVDILAKGDEEPESAIALVGDMKVLIPLAGLINKDAEAARIAKKVSGCEKEYEMVNSKLSNPNFVDRAPEAVVTKEREKLTRIESDLKNLKTQLDKIRSL